MMSVEGWHPTFGGPGASFPQMYRGLPVTVTKIKQSDLQPLLRALEGLHRGGVGEISRRVGAPS
jgi:hypothetical protein